MHFRAVSLLIRACVMSSTISLYACNRTPVHPATLPVPEVRAVGGVASFRLDAVLTTAGTPAFSYKGRVGVAPTIRVEPGDRIEVTLHNAMHAEPSHSNDVNLHFHGLAVSPRAPSDDVLDMLARPGQTLHYIVRVPRSHEPGLYWYHPHVHGQTFWQVAHGMSGALVIEGLQRRIPALSRMRERIVILRQKPTGSDINEASNAPDSPESVENADGNPCRPELALHPTIDGQTRERFEIRHGEQQFFRVVNASASRYFDLSIDGVTLDVVALDGVPLSAYPGARAVSTVTHLMLAPAGRAEFVVRGPSASGFLRSRCVDSGPFGDAQPPLILGELIVTPAVSASDVATSWSQTSERPGPPRSRALPAPVRRRSIRLTEDANNFYIDGRTFDMKSMMRPAAVVARAGTIEEWDVSNDTDETHDFHIHQVHFAEESRNGVRLGDRHWIDTVNIPSRRHYWNYTTPGTVRLLVDFRNPVVRGAFLFHCHILDHEDRGMAAKIEVR